MYLLKTLKNKSGASLAFILALSLLLLAVGTSALTAAGSVSAAAVNQRVVTQMNLYGDSLHNSVFAMLQSDDAQSLAAALYQRMDEQPEGSPVTVVFSPDISDMSDIDDLNLAEYQPRVSILLHYYPWMEPGTYYGDAEITVRLNHADTGKSLTQTMRCQFEYKYTDDDGSVQEWEWRIMP